MTRDIASAASIRSLLGKLTPAEWSHARILAPQLDDALRRSCKIHRAQALFDPSGKLTPLVAARLAALSAPDLLIVSSAFAAAAEHGALPESARESGLHADDTAHQGEVAEPTPMGPGLAEFIAQSVTLAGEKQPSAAGPAGDAARQERLGSEDRLPRGEITHLQDLIAELRDSQEHVLAALGRIQSRIEHGAAAASDDLAQLGRWQERLGEAALALNGQPGEFDLTSLAEAVEAALSTLRDDERNSELIRMLREIGTAEFDNQKKPLLEVVAGQAQAADPRSMPEGEKEAFRALHRLMSVPLHAVDAHDAETVQIAFGMQVLLGAASALLTHAHEPSSAPAGEPSSAPAGEPAPAEAGEPAPAEAGEPAPAEAPEPMPKGAPEGAQEATPAPPSGGLTQSAVHKPHAATAGEKAKSTAAQPGPLTPAVPQPASPLPETEIAETRPKRSQSPSTQPGEPESGSGVLDSRIEDAVGNRHYGLVYWYSVTLKLPVAVQAACEVLALSEAITVDGDDCSVRIRELLYDFDVTSVAQNSEYLKILAAGCAQALLRMPFSPCLSVLQDATTLIPDGDASAFLATVLHAAAFGVELGKLREEHGRSLAELITSRDSTLGTLSSVMGTARLSRTRYARATQVWRRFISDQGPLGGPVSRVLASPEGLGSAEDLLARLRDQRAVDRLIDETDRRLNPVAARRSKIVNGARDELRSDTADLLDSLRSYVEAARAAGVKQRAGTSDQLGDAVELLTRAVANADEEPGTVGAGSLAIGQVKRWLRGVLVQHGRLPDKQLPVAAVLARDLSRCYEVRRLDDGTIVPGSVTPEILGVAASRPPEDAYNGFVASDDHTGAEQLIDVLRGDGQAELAAQLADRQQEDRRVSRERLRMLLATGERELDQALYTAVLSESESAALRGKLERLRNVEVVDFIAAKRRVNGIIAKVAAARDAAIAAAHQQLSSLDPPEDVRQRIVRQLDEGDLVNAREFLAQLATGTQGLPTEVPADETLTEFWPAFVEAITAGASSQSDPGDLRWLRDAAAQHADIAGLTLLPHDSGPMVERGLQGWFDLTRTKRSRNWQDSLKNVLNLMGLEVKGGFDQTPHRFQRWWTKIQAIPVGQALVPTYGSACAGHYQLLLCWEKVSPDRLLALLDEKPQQPPVIVLYFNTLSKRERRTLAEHSRPRNKNISAIVVDNAVISFLASRTEARLQTTMGITLPFTAINPYTPFVLGDVPREVFYGRKEELGRVQDANDALFVYGGRQLGKSALLKTAMREFAETDTRWRSIYIDLKAEGVGEWREPDDLWPVLVPHLQKAGIADSKMSAKASADVVVPQIRRWLEADSERRILLLLDEADAFLETDARARSLVGEARFINIYRLKGLMDGSNRRFKPVFAGLHQVQRFHSASNGPMAHVGAEIPIGPLPPSEAYKLVVKPLAAIGYRVEKPEVAWRLLAYTNYQASLIQLFCDALVRRLHRRPVANGAPPTVIGDRDIDEIYSDKEVRDQIATRFEWTINLDNRYRVIASTTAWLALNTDSQVFAIITLYDECKTFWPAGFAELNLDDFSAYLDEMVGLGILVRTPADEYGIRSPNVIRMLGAPEEIERRLIESEALEVSRPFDPAMFRRALGGNPDRRSPLSEQQVQQILNGRGSVHIVIGSTALGLDRVVEALREAAPEDIEVRVATCDAIKEASASLSRAKTRRRHLVLDLAGAGSADQRTALQQLHGYVSGDTRLTASSLAPPSSCWLWENDLTGVQVERVRIHPWTHESLRAWAPDCVYPLSTAEQRTQLLEATGGWPQLVEAAVQAARAGATDGRARQEAAGTLNDTKVSIEFLLSVGLSADPVADEVAEIAANWSDEMAFDDIATLVDADREAVLTSVTRLVDLGVLNRGSSGDVYRINPLIATLLRTE